jgi:hypothetical protein
MLVWSLTKHLAFLSITLWRGFARLATRVVSLAGRLQVATDMASVRGRRQNPHEGLKHIETISGTNMMRDTVMEMADGLMVLSALAAGIAKHRGC